jgi:hypothetical protein
VDGGVMEGYSRKAADIPADESVTPAPIVDNYTHRTADTAVPAAIETTYPTRAWTTRQLTIPGQQSREGTEG